MSGELRRVMLVDDDELISEFAVMILESTGLEILYCDSGRKALDRVNEFRPQLVLLDFIMPEMNGLDTLRELRALPEVNSTPIVFLTGKADREGSDAAMMEAGAAGIIRKPFAPDMLLSDIETIWQQHVA